jgi:hypothetical protein
VRFFLDRDLGKRLGYALRQLGVDVELHIERYPGIGDIPDEQWIEEVTKAGYLILSHDARIRRRPIERGAFERVGARAFVFATRRPTPFAHMKALMLAWDRIEGIVVAVPAPFMFGVAADGRLNQYLPRS